MAPKQTAIEPHLPLGLSNEILCILAVQRAEHCEMSNLKVCKKCLFGTLKQLKSSLPLNIFEPYFPLNYPAIILQKNPLESFFKKLTECMLCILLVIFQLLNHNQSLYR